ncbi:hypothetical protein [Microbacterium jejuense]|uniref:hypothetical protein n=1 Tax=Microbacterium jejuense TaxID=1263637 RepID=UPI0031F013A3
MSPNRVLIAGAFVVVVASAAILVPGVASGQLAPLLPATSVVAPDVPGAGQGDGDKGGNGKAWGHHKDDPAFPGDNGRGHGSPGDTSPGDTGNGDDTGDGKAWGHRKDDPAFPGGNGRGHRKGSAGTDSPGG